MVKLEEIVDEEFEKNINTAGDELWDTDDDSVSSFEDEDDYIEDETLLDRVYALRDVIPPNRRKELASTYDTASNWAKWGVGFGGNTAWILLSSALVLGGPFFAALIGFEREKEMAGQAYANDALMNPDGDKKEAQAAL